MKNVLITGLALLIISSCKNNTQQLSSESIKFQISSVSDYCGGAAPTDEVMQELQTPKPYEAVLYIHAATDARREGQFLELELRKGFASTVSLAAGDYVAYNKPVYQIDSSQSDWGAEMCKYEQSFMPLFNFKINGPSELVTDTCMLQCDPCVPPMP